MTMETMNTSKSTSKSASKNTYKYPSTEPALYYLEDVFSRAVCPFILLGQTAKNIKENLDQDSHTTIEIGVKKNDLTQYAFSTLKTYFPSEAVYTDKKITFEWQGTPITIKIIHKKWKFLKNLDQVFYKLTYFRIPNPFNKYWKSRGLIR